MLLLCSSIVKAQNKSVTELKECYCEFIVINHVRLKSLLLSLTLIFFVRINFKIQFKNQANVENKHFNLCFEKKGLAECVVMEGLPHHQY